MKKCKKCKKTKSKDSFNKNKARKDGLYYYCRKCQNQQTRKWKQNNQHKMLEYRKNHKDEERIRHKRYIQRKPEEQKEAIWRCNLKKKYGITAEQYDVLIIKQNSCCAICKEKETSKVNGKVRHLAVDHCHTTGRIRGLLCVNCNIALGRVRDRIDILKNMFDYLMEY